MKLSGKDLQFFDEASKSHYTPLLIECSAGMDRTALTFLVDAFERESGVDPNGKQTERAVLRFHPQIAPVQVAVFSLARNKSELVERARGIEARLRPRLRTQYDEGNIGQLYRRQDEIGTPLCVTVDYETVADGSVTVRARDSMRQERVSAEALESHLAERLA
jgi:glycyl-tRNA synthetase